MADLMQMRLQSEEGRWFPLTVVATIESTYVTDYIVRRDGKRMNTIYASIDKTQVAPADIAQDLFDYFIPDLEQRIPQVAVIAAGELEEIGNLKSNLINALFFACVLIYTLLAIPLKSYWQPLIIMSVIPFGFVGAAMGHLMMDLPLSFLSFLGMLALTGVVVNDSLLLITRYNQNKAQGSTVHEALMEAGPGRFKAIFLTTVTTVAGLMPLMSETSEQAQYLIPAAVSLAYGELFATLITLILVPVLIYNSSLLKNHHKTRRNTFYEKINY
ncbi:MAG: efflux RND transporter permease subunit [Gammaproteobacteria bacterium]|nr:efflux RND transporter permease subunit [Gammaproteobacteria bacterium]